jgi:hypothetical protein
MIILEFFRSRSVAWLGARVYVRNNGAASGMVEWIGRIKL